MPKGKDTNGNGRPLRFAALVRVSTEKQEKKGESLRTQRAHNERDVALLGGAIVGWYGGQEHATEGWEKKEILRLAADAAKGKFDAVMIAHADRWDRGGEEARQARKEFEARGVRFFISTTEYDLRNPEHALFLDLSSAIGKFHAANQRKKSLLNRIARARRGVPASGKLPFGRTWSEAAGWGIDPKKQALIADVAARYLAGEGLPKLANKHGVNHANLCKVLRERCGETWAVDFKAPDLNVNETVVLTVPRLLPEETCRRLRERLTANRTYLHKPPVSRYEYLLSGHLFCAACGYGMFGQVNQHGRRYYRHAHTKRDRPCPLTPRPWVRADAVEASVVAELFRLYGNPVAIERAVRAAVPDCEKLLAKRQQLEADLGKVGKARERLLGLIVKGLLTDAQAEKQLAALAEREGGLRSDLDRLAGVLAELPDEEQVRSYVKRSPGFVWVLDEKGNVKDGGNDLGTLLKMTAGDKRRLIEGVFAHPLPGGAPAGVYVQQLREPPGDWYYGPTVEHGGVGVLSPKRWGYTIKGRLDFECVVPCASH
jgi:DNA invertase Pin-like site-specific DNA recombinase